MTGCESEEMKTAKEDYNNEVQRITSQEDELNAIIAEGEALLGQENLSPWIHKLLQI